FNLSVTDINNAPTLNTTSFAGSGTAGDPFTDLAGTLSVAVSGQHHFDLNGQTFSTFVDQSGYIQVALDFGNGVGVLPQLDSLTNSARGLLTDQTLAQLTDVGRVRISSSDGTLDAITTNATIMQRVIDSEPLHGGVNDNAINNDWAGTGAEALTNDASCPLGFTNALSHTVANLCGQNEGMQWIPENSWQRIQNSTDEIADDESLTLWVSGSKTFQVDEGDTFTFSVTSTDADSSDTTTFSIQNLPSWATFSTTTGLLSGTPAESDAGTYDNIIITATDNGTPSLSSSLLPFAIQVNDINNAPVISGTPSTTVAEGAAYSFTPIVSDNDAGDTLTYSITNKPDWAFFNTATGELFGTPLHSDVGTYTNIQITVTDDGAGSL
ncbi:putative Ig domain-containing protein, partial [Enterovibrio norvegicus]